MLSFLSGALMFGFAIAGVFFLDFWRRTRDRLFLMFALSFWLLAAERLVLVVLTDGRNEEHTLLYLFRLGAFVLILLAIANKNREEGA